MAFAPLARAPPAPITSGPNAKKKIRFLSILAFLEGFAGAKPPEKVPAGAYLQARATVLQQIYKKNYFFLFLC